MIVFMYYFSRSAVQICDTYTGFYATKTLHFLPKTWYLYLHCILLLGSSIGSGISASILSKKIFLKNRFWVYNVTATISVIFAAITYLFSTENCIALIMTSLFVMGATTNILTSTTQKDLISEFQGNRAEYGATIFALISCGLETLRGSMVRFISVFNPSNQENWNPDRDEHRVGEYYKKVYSGVICGLTIATIIVFLSRQLLYRKARGFFYAADYIGGSIIGDGSQVLASWMSLS